jgi:crossover junction endodeoxyribonuclease RuvC
MVRTARTLFGLEARLADEADALAIAVCHLARGPVAFPGRSRGSATSSADRARRALRPAVRRYGEVP